ncbi:hypothetical protein C6B37_01305 [Candidatus Phytoplasma phoenicium]|uniref:AAA+ ATPase domain-containing protein n=1 Tax=Candidatus Phytoplasma phoenicium TaxID=198422 RepID=A0A2S8NUV0_9MOLU|nr:hypothetical protein C6B37_01305 [Candidatus Phytoplasma phoenicium]
MSIKNKMLQKNYITLLFIFCFLLTIFDNQNYSIKAQSNNLKNSNQKIKYFCFFKQKRKKLNILDNKLFEILQNKINFLEQQLKNLDNKYSELIKEKKEVTPLNRNKMHLLEYDKSLQIKSENNNQIKTLKNAIELIKIEKNIIEIIKKTNFKDDFFEMNNLENYEFFLNEQSLIFEQQINEKSFSSNSKNKILFKDVFGMQNEKEELQDLICYFNSDYNLVNFEQIKPKGYLLYGAPGTGKSFLIKALCNEANVYYIELEPSKFDKKYIGEGKEELEKIWQEAEKHEKCIIFIDEINGLASREESNAHITQINIVHNLLTKLDGFKTNNNKIVLVGATNYPEKIDKALRSRFSKEIKINSISDTEIENFLKHIIKSYQINYYTFLHLQNISNKCRGKNYSNRDLVSIIEDAYKKTNKHYNNIKHNVMLPSDLDEALNSKQNIPQSIDEIKKNREICENQHQNWKEIKNLSINF